MISLLVPTRNRPDGFNRMLKSLQETAKGQVEVVASVDDDDPCLKKYQEFKGIKLLVNQRVILSQQWNRCAKAASGDIHMMGADDMMFRTAGWDEILESAFASCPDKILMAFGDDLSPYGKQFATHFAIHRRWIDAVGYFVPPYFVGDCSDSWVNEVAMRLGRHCLLPFVTEHMHFMWKKGEIDSTIRDRRRAEDKHDPKKVYESLAGKLLEDVAKLRSLLDSAWQPTSQDIKIAAAILATSQLMQTYIAPMPDPFRLGVPTCPQCGRSAFVVWSNGMRRCNADGKHFEAA